MDICLKRGKLSHNNDNKKSDKICCKIRKNCHTFFFVPKRDEQNCYEMNINRKIFFCLTSGFKGHLFWYLPFYIQSKSSLPMELQRHRILDIYVVVAQKRVGGGGDPCSFYRWRWPPTEKRMQPCCGQHCTAALLFCPLFFTGFVLLLSRIALLFIAKTIRVVLS